jgi:hypothetical protein
MIWLKIGEIKRKRSLITAITVNINYDSLIIEKEELKK